MNKFDKNTEIKVYGENAVNAVFNNRPEDIIKLFVTQNKSKKFAHITKYLATHKKAYHIVEPSELEKITQATHHEEICVLTKKIKPVTLQEYLKQPLDKDCLFILENVTNPHNVGAIIRTMAHFGCKTLLVQDVKTVLNASAMRTAEGGFEYINLIEHMNLAEVVKSLAQANYQIVVTSSHAKNDIYKLKWQPKTAIFFGEERDGLTKQTLSLGVAIKIPGTDQVESLNVGVAVAVVASEYFRSSQN